MTFNVLACLGPLYEENKVMRLNAITLRRRLTSWGAFLLGLLWFLPWSCPASTLRVSGGVLTVNASVTANELVIAPGAVLRGDGDVAGGAVVAGTIQPGGADVESVGTLTFHDTLAFLPGSTFQGYAASHGSLDQLIVSGIVSGAGMVLFTKSATAVPLEQIIIDGGAGSDYSGLLLAPALTNDWLLFTASDNLLLTDLAGDSDGDLLPDWWESEYFDDRTDGIAEDDDDSDAKSNLDEYIADTDPLDGNSFFHIVEIVEDTNTIRLTWNSAAGRVYSVERTELLTNSAFAVLASELNAVLPQNTYTDSVSSVTTYFYRVGVSLP